MKKISATLAIGALLSLGACSEYDFDSKYEDPSKVNEVSIDRQWDNLYSSLTQYRKMESLYNDEAAGVQAQNEAFMLAAKIHLYDFFAATVDIFGDMPFKEACMLPITNDVSGSYAHYDKAEDIYKTIMDELKEAVLRLPEVNGTDHRNELQPLLQGSAGRGYVLHEAVLGEMIVDELTRRQVDEGTS